jgi:hypothetical protein
MTDVEFKAACELQDGRFPGDAGSLEKSGLFQRVEKGIDSKSPPTRPESNPRGAPSGSRRMGTASPYEPPAEGAESGDDAGESEE